MVKIMCFCVEILTSHKVKNLFEKYLNFKSFILILNIEILSVGSVFGKDILVNLCSLVSLCG